MPFGVLMLRVGRAGRESLGGWAVPMAPTGFTLGEGGMARPSLGVRGPLLRPPPMAGRRRGAGVFITGTGFDDCIGAKTSWGTIYFGAGRVSELIFMGGESQRWRGGGGRRRQRNGGSREQLGRRCCYCWLDHTSCGKKHDQKVRQEQICSYRGAKSGYQARGPS